MKKLLVAVAVLLALSVMMTEMMLAFEIEDLDGLTPEGLGKALIFDSGWEATLYWQGDGGFREKRVVVEEAEPGHSDGFSRFCNYPGYWIYGIDVSEYTKAWAVVHIANQYCVEVASSELSWDQVTQSNEKLEWTKVMEDTTPITDLANLKERGIYLEPFMPAKYVYLRFTDSYTEDAGWGSVLFQFWLFTPPTT